MEKEETGTKSLKKRLQAVRRRLSTKVLETKKKEQEGRASYEAGVALRWKMKKKRKEDEQWEEEQHLDDLIERRRMEGSSLKLDVVLNGRICYEVDG